MVILATTTSQRTLGILNVTRLGSSGPSASRCKISLFLYFSANWMVVGMFIIAAEVQKDKKTQKTTQEANQNKSRLIPQK
jgi:hypothetical protein